MSRIKIYILVLMLILQGASFVLSGQVKNNVISIQSAGKFNYVTNGDFTLGNVHFFTDYDYSPKDLAPEGKYTIDYNPKMVYTNFASCKDHTDGTGLMLIVNGSIYPNQVVWEQTVNNLQTGVDYIFSFWYLSLEPKMPAELEIYFNDIKVAPAFKLESRLSSWREFSFIWNSGSCETANIRIVDSSIVAKGNDFGLDDISLREPCILQIEKTGDKLLCEGSDVQLNCTVKRGYPPYSYKWYPDDDMDDANIPNPKITNIMKSKTIYLNVTDSLGCSVLDSVRLDVMPLPPALLTSEGDMQICPCGSKVISAPEGFNYLWNTGDTSRSITVSDPGIYTVEISNANNCRMYSEIEIREILIDPIVEIDTIYANVGDRITVGIRPSLNNADICGIKSYKAKLSFNKSILMPIHNADYEFDGSKQIIGFNGNLSDNSISNHEFMVLLGDVECTDIKIESIDWDCDEIISKFRDGMVCIKDICRTPTPRLFGSSGKLFLGCINPNPADNQAMVEFGLIEEGRTKLIITDIIGNNVYTVLDKVLSPVIYQIDFNTDYLNSGIYHIILQTPTGLIKEKFTVLH